MHSTSRPLDVSAFGRRVVIAILLLAGPLLATAQQLLQGIQLGISRSEVMRLAPQAVAVESSPRDVKAGLSAAEIQSLPFAGKTFTARFSFQSDRLIQIHMHDTVSMEPNDTTRAAFERISATLRQTYGKETSRELESRPSGLFGEASWIQGDKRIYATVSPMTQHHSTILINFMMK